MTIDLDAFFASCEELRNPELIGTPMGVGFELNGRGIVTTANYAARKFGVKSAMPIFKAKQLCPDIKVVAPDHDYYQDKANEVFNVVYKYSKIMEIASIDECFIDVTKLTNKYTPLQIAQMIKNDIKKKTDLTVSIGISTDLLLSKMASGMDKPNGITTLWIKELKDKLWPLPVGDMYMIGCKTSEKLNSLGIETIGQLANLKNNHELYKKTRKIMGVNLDKLINEANGESKREIEDVVSQLKSLSKEETFGTSLTDIESILREMRKLLKYAYERLQYRKLNANSLHVFIKVDKSFKRLSVSKRFDRKDNDWDSIWSIAFELMSSNFVEGMSVKQIGVGFSGLKEGERVYEQLTLDSSQVENIPHLQSIADDASWSVHEDVFIGSTMNDNRRYEDKRLIDRDQIKFKIWG